jgi:hypothetical protein
MARKVDGLKLKPSKPSNPAVQIFRVFCREAAARRELESAAGGVAIAARTANPTQPVRES